MRYRHLLVQLPPQVLSLLLLLALFMGFLNYLLQHLPTWDHIYLLLLLPVLQAAARRSMHFQKGLDNQNVNITWSMGTVNMDLLVDTIIRLSGVDLKQVLSSVLWASLFVRWESLHANFKLKFYILVSTSMFLNFVAKAFSMLNLTFLSLTLKSGITLPYYFRDRLL